MERWCGCLGQAATIAEVVASAIAARQLAVLHYLSNAKHLHAASAFAGRQEVLCAFIHLAVAHSVSAELTGQFVRVAACPGGWCWHLCVRVYMACTIAVAKIDRPIKGCRKVLPAHPSTHLENKKS